MKKLLLGLSALLLIGLSFAVPQRAAAHEVSEGETTIHIAARGAECGLSGYITPKTMTFSYGRKVTLTFENVQPTKLEIRNFPGGTFVVTGNSMVEKTFRATESFDYSAWLQTNNCKKADAKVVVTSGGFIQQSLTWIFVVVGAGATAFFIIREVRRKPTKPTSTPTGDNQ